MDSHFPVRKIVQVGQFLSSSENSPGWAVPFQFEKWFDIFDGQSFSSSENGLDQTVIFAMKMVR
jgi:hypothetical protein